MFAYCCEHATIVASRQPYRLSWCGAKSRRPGGCALGLPLAGGNLEAIRGITSLAPGFRHPRRGKDSDNRPGIADDRKRNATISPDNLTWSVRILDRACARCRNPKLQCLTSIVFEEITSFLCGRHFFLQFSSRCDAATTHAARAQSSSISKLEQCRKQFVAGCLRVAKMRRCVEIQG